MGRHWEVSGKAVGRERASRTSKVPVDVGEERLSVPNTTGAEISGCCPTDVVSEQEFPEVTSAFRGGEKGI